MPKQTRLAFGYCLHLKLIFDFRNIGQVWIFWTILKDSVHLMRVSNDYEIIVAIMYSCQNGVCLFTSK